MMETYWNGCKKILLTKIQALEKVNRIILLSNWAICGKKKLTSNDRKKNFTILMIILKMNKIINKFLLTGDKF